MAQQSFLFSARLVKKLPALRKISWPLEALIVKGILLMMKMMSPERGARFANFVFRNLKPVLPFAKKIRRNLTVAFPEKDRAEIEQLTKSVCGNLGNAAAELVYAEKIWLERDERMEFVLQEGVDLSDYDDRPAVMVTGHMGAWQIAGFVASEYNLRLTTIYAPEKNPALRDAFFKLRSSLPCRFISRDGCMRGLTKELKNGHIIGLTSDTRLDSGDLIPFFGVPVPTNTTAARLALHHDCDFLPVRAERLPNMRFRITLCRPIRPREPSASVAEKARQMTQTLLEHFETWIRDNPDQWMCFGRRWPHEVYSDASIASNTGDEA